jgi:ActR/RegA family two-component response regulator
MSAEQTMTILIVDDNTQYREAFTRALLLEGYEVRAAADLDEALRSIQAQLPDLVVTDLQMRTEREGLDLIEILKAFDPLLPVIMISGVGSFEEGALATQLGAVHVIHKSRIEDEMEGFFETIRTAHAACRHSRDQLAAVAQAREAEQGADRDERIIAVKALLAAPDVDAYVKSEAYDMVATLGNAELLRESQGTMKAASTSDRYEDLSAAALTRLRRELRDYDGLSEETKRALTTAEYLHGTQGESGTPDFSRSIAFSYSLAVECEVRVRLKGRITRLANAPAHRRLLEACMDLKTGRMDMCFQQSLMQATRYRGIHFTIASVKFILMGMLSRKGKSKAYGLKDVALIMLCFAREYSFRSGGKEIKVKNPLRVKGLGSEEELIALVGSLIALQQARNPYVHPDTGKREQLSHLRQLALESLKQLGKVE